MRQKSLKAFILTSMVVIIPAALLLSSFRIYEGLRRQLREPDSITLRIVDLSSQPQPGTRVTLSEWGWRYWIPLPFTGRPSKKNIWTQTTDADGRITIRWKDDFLEINELKQNNNLFAYALVSYHRSDGTTSPPTSVGLGGIVAEYRLHSYTAIEYAISPDLKHNNQ